MSEHTITLHNPQHAHEVWSRAWQWVKARTLQGRPVVLTLAEEKRSSEQNRAMWAALSDVSRQVEWYGQRLSPEDWKHVMSASLYKQRTVPGIDGGFVVLGQSTSKMTKAQFSELLELIHAFGNERGVEWSDDAQR